MKFSFKDIVEEQLQIIQETRKIEDLCKIAAFNKLDKNQLSRILSFDPTYNHDGYAGKYSVYLLDQYIKGNLDGKWEQQMEIRNAIWKFHQNKNSIQKNNIKDYTIDELVNAMKNFNADNQGKSTEWPPVEQMLMRNPSQMYLFLGKYGDYEVYSPLTPEAARKLGGSTRWCTSSSNMSYFWHYTLDKETPLYMFFKDGRPVAQSTSIYFDEMRDDEDEDIDFPGETYPEIPYEDGWKLRKYFFAFTTQYISSEYNIINKALANGDDMMKWFEERTQATEGLMAVKRNGRWGAFSTIKNQLVSSLEYGSMTYLNNGILALCPYPGSEYDFEEGGEYWVFFNQDGILPDGQEDALMAAYEQVRSGRKTPEQAFDKVMTQDGQKVGVIDDISEFCINLENGEIVDRTIAKYY